MLDFGPTAVDLASHVAVSSQSWSKANPYLKQKKLKTQMS
jgi:hypothetical protein